MHHGQVRIEVRPVTAPDGSSRVLLQLETGFVLLLPDAAVALGQMLIVTAGEADQGVAE